MQNLPTTATTHAQAACASGPSALARRIGKPCLAALLLMGWGALAHAHTDAATESGFLSGFMHPLVGLDHLLAMVAVGIWGAVLSRPLMWVLPVVFPLLMVVGAVLGMAGIELPYVETGIAASVVVLGLAIAAAWHAPIGVAVAIVAGFGVFHGHAHGTELPEAASPAGYAVGFVLSTGLLHLAGVAIGLLQSISGGLQLLRVCGGLIALCGVWFLLGMPGMPA